MSKKSKSSSFIPLLPFLDFSRNNKKQIDALKFEELWNSIGSTHELVLSEIITANSSLFSNHTDTRGYLNCSQAQSEDP